MPLIYECDRGLQEAAFKALSAVGPKSETVAADFISRGRTEGHQQYYSGLPVTRRTEGISLRMLKKLPAGIAGPGEMPNRPPRDDHPTLLLVDGQPTFYVSEPFRLGIEELRQILAFCEQWGLNVSLQPTAGTYFPGSTNVLVYSDKATDKAREDGDLFAARTMPLSAGAVPPRP